MEWCWSSPPSREHALPTSVSPGALGTGEQRMGPKQVTGSVDRSAVILRHSDPNTDFPWIVNQNHMEVHISACSIQPLTSFCLTKGVLLWRSQLLLIIANTCPGQQHLSLTGVLPCLLENTRVTLGSYHWAGPQYRCPDKQFTPWSGEFQTSVCNKTSIWWGRWHVMACSSAYFCICTPDLHTTAQPWLW